MTSGVCFMGSNCIRGFNAKPNCKNPQVNVIVDHLSALNSVNLLQMAGRGVRDGSQPSIDCFWKREDETSVHDSEKVKNRVVPMIFDFGNTQVLYQGWRIILVEKKYTYTWIKAFRQAVTSWNQMGTDSFEEQEDMFEAIEDV